MKAEDLMLGNLVSVNGRICKVVELGGMVCVASVIDELDQSLCYGEDVDSISIIPEILEKNGWKFKSGYWVLKGHSTRLGWRNGEMVVGYAALPEKIFHVHELQNLMKAVKISCNFEI